MSFKQYDTIHLGNYEEFFVLYMDRELSEAQMQMVDEFLIAHPDLRPEFDLLMSTRLPMETYTINKDALMAEQMYPGSVAEDLLLYIDDELPADKKNIIEFELTANREYQQQFEILLKTKLDAADTITYPDKSELYRSTRKVMPISGWMKIAATVVVMALAGIVYMIRNDVSRNDDSIVSVPASTQTNKTAAPLTNESAKKENNPADLEKTNEKAIPADLSSDKNQTANTDRKVQPVKQQKYLQTPQNNRQNDLIAVNTPVENNDVIIPDVPLRERNNDAIVSRTTRTGVVSKYDPEQSSVSVNNSPVTSLLTDRNTNDVASNDKKGSVKGFLRKATRLIEKKTGFDPIDENGELLIGMVAVKLK